MNKEEVKNLIVGRMLGNKRGVNAFLSPAKLSDKAMIQNWMGAIKPPTNAPISNYWFAFVDYSPDANFEHPVEYVFINDKTGESHVVRGTTPPDNINHLERIA